MMMIDLEWLRKKREEGRHGWRNNFTILAKEVSVGRTAEVAIGRNCG